MSSGLKRCLIGVMGTVLVGAGLAALLLAYQQVAATDAAARVAQAALLEEDPSVGADEAVLDGDRLGGTRFEPGARVATLSFSRVIDETYAVVEGTDREALTTGPGRYLGTAEPGGAGNFAVAGHRTTYGSPFRHIDQLELGDAIFVRDEQGAEFTYEVVETRVVEPADVWVIQPDPLERGRPLLTLTTCHPVYSAKQRLVVWAELVPVPGAAPS